eukprot:jgi/Botrbrau1/19809/Bobra.0124s0052.1
MGKTQRQSCGDCSTSGESGLEDFTREADVPEDQALLHCPDSLAMEREDEGVALLEQVSSSMNALPGLGTVDAHEDTLTNILGASHIDHGLAASNPGSALIVNCPPDSALSEKHSPCENWLTKDRNLLSPATECSYSAIKVVEAEDSQRTDCAQVRCGTLRTSSTSPYAPLTSVAQGVESLQRLETPDEGVTMRKVNQYMLWRICLICFFNYLDRTNLSFAAVTMKKDLSLSDYQYGVGSSAFFVSYAALQVPFTCIMVRIGAPKFLGVSLLFWGLFSSSFAAVQNVAAFYSLRILLGVAETGAFPGLWWHLLQWYSEEEVGFSYSYTSAVIAAAQVLGGPLAAACLHMDGLLGLAGWRWLFLLQGIPPMILGLYLFFTLPRRPIDAKFLSLPEREWLQHRQWQARGGPSASMNGQGMAQGEKRRWKAMLDWRVYALGAMDGLVGSAKYGIIYWAPLIIVSLLSGSANQSQPLKGSQPDESGGHTPSPVLVVLLAAIPFGVAATFTLANAYHSKLTGERRLHIIVPTFGAAAGLAFLAASLHSHPVLGLVSLTLGSLAFAPTAVQSSYPASFLKGSSAAIGWAVMNSVANLGGLLGPYLIGAVKKVTGSFVGSIAALSGVTAVAGIMYTLLLPLVAPDPRETRKAALPSLEEQALSATTDAPLRQRDGARYA